ncbi:MAG TPA: hypothetical protein PK110_15250 [Niabella sp.]|nr:hypothetical protein [Niabella sp.]HUN03925.1 hypothetical protein [Niabella sp.]
MNGAKRSEKSPCFQNSKISPLRYEMTIKEWRNDTSIVPVISNGTQWSEKSFSSKTMRYLPSVNMTLGEDEMTIRKAAV